ncbi:hypothetical protein [Nostoc sp. CCY0012]
MTRRPTPPNNGKPRKTESGTIRLKSQKNIIDQQPRQKSDDQQ